MPPAARQLHEATEIAIRRRYREVRFLALPPLLNITYLSANLIFILPDIRRPTPGGVERHGSEDSAEQGRT
jgi:hypothetical protein